MIVLEILVKNHPVPHATVVAAKINAAALPISLTPSQLAVPFVYFSHLPCYNQAGKEVIQLAKTDKELAVELMGSYLTGLYSAGNMKPLDPESIKKILQAFYDAVKSVTD